MNPRVRNWLLRAAAVLVCAGFAVGFDHFTHKPAGDYCKSPSECRSRLCSSAGYCTKHCKLDGDCPPGFACRASKVYTNPLDVELAGEGVDVKGGTSEMLCRR